VSTSDTAAVVVGRVQGAYGLNGWVRLISYTDPPDNLLAYRSDWLLGGPDGWHSVASSAARPQGKNYVARFADSNDRDSAQALQGLEIAVPATALPAPAEDEYYWRELIGMAVVDLRGRQLGSVVELMATGANDVLVVAPAAGVRQLIPFSRQHVTRVDVQARQLTVDWDPD
jgi:16S rRNA processing protein RimM